MDFSADDLRSFNKACSKKIGLNICVPNDSTIYLWVQHCKLQQSDYYDFSKLTFSNYSKHTCWKTFSCNLTKRDGVIFSEYILWVDI